MVSLSNSEWTYSDRNVGQYLQHVVHYLCTFSWYLGIYLLINCIIVNLGIARRYLRIKFGRRIKPDRRRAIMITGATAGIGLALSKHFYKLGFSVIAGYYNDQEPGYTELLEHANKPYESICKKKGENLRKPELFLVRMDVRSIESIADSRREIDALLEKHDIELYCLINNAGISVDGPFEWCARKSIKDLIDTNVTGVMMVTREFVLNIILNKGRIINVSSGVFITPGPGISVYGGSKSAIAYFSASLQRDIDKYGASSVCVLPGNFISTSSIIYPRIKTTQESERQLLDKERSVYKKSIEEYKRLMYRLLQIKFETSDDDPNQIASFYKIDLPDFTTIKKKSNCFIRFVQWFVSLLDGSVSPGKTLENSGILEGYEAAVCLEQAPETIFAGDSFYTNYSGPFLEYLPRVAYGLLTWFFNIGVSKD